MFKFAIGCPFSSSSLDNFGEEISCCGNVQWLPGNVQGLPGQCARVSRAMCKGCRVCVQRLLGQCANTWKQSQLVVPSPLHLGFDWSLTTNLSKRGSAKKPRFASFFKSSLTVWSFTNVSKVFCNFTVQKLLCEIGKVAKIIYSYIFRSKLV